MVEVALERLCPYCNESLSLNKEESQKGNILQCPICRKNVKVELKGIFSKRLILKKTSLF